jgi:hypothetical protein
MTTKVSAFMGGLGRDATNKFVLADNATVTVGAASTGNVIVGGEVVATSFIGDGSQLTGLALPDELDQSLFVGVDSDFGTLTTANTTATDAFGQVVSDLDILDMLDEPARELAVRDAGALG